MTKLIIDEKELILAYGIDSKEYKFVKSLVSTQTLTDEEIDLIIHYLQPAYTETIYRKERMDLIKKLKGDLNGN